MPTLGQQARMDNSFHEMVTLRSTFGQQEYQSLDALCTMAAQVFQAEVTILLLTQNGIRRIIACHGVDQRFRSRQWRDDHPIAPDEQIILLDSHKSPAIQSKLASLGLDSGGFFLRTAVLSAPDHVLSLVISSASIGKKPTARQMRLLADVKYLLQHGFQIFSHLLTDPEAHVTATVSLDEALQATARSGIPAALMDSTLKILAVSEGMAELLDIPRQKLVGMTHDDVHVPMSDAIAALYRHALNTRISPPDFEIVTSEDGHRGVFRVTASPFSPLETKDYFLFVTAKDVTELHARESRLSKRIGMGAAKPEPSLDFLCETLVERRTIRARKTVNYITLRAWRASIRDWQIKALRALKGNLPSTMPDVIAEEILAEISALVGVSAFKAVVPIPCGHTREGPCLSLEMARALGQKIGIPVVQAFVTQPMKGTSHPKENVKRPPLVLTRPLNGPVLLVDDVATSGAHIEEAVKLLRPHTGSVLAVAWIGGDST